MKQARCLHLLERRIDTISETEAIIRVKQTAPRGLRKCLGILGSCPVYQLPSGECLIDVLIEVLMRPNIVGPSVDTVVEGVPPQCRLLLYRHCRRGAHHQSFVKAQLLLSSNISFCVDVTIIVVPIR